MIQVCSQCGTRWNVRDQRRAWCPRCNGALWAPLTDAQVAELQRAQPPAPPAGMAGMAPPAPPGPAQPAAGSAQPSPPGIGAGYRWIAVRPGPPPRPHRQRRPLGPTPRYAVMPRWTLMQPVNPAALRAGPAQRPGPAIESVEKALTVAMAALGGAALAYLIVYLLLVVNRTVLLNPVLAGAVVWLSRLAALAGVGALVWCAVRLVRWLIARRAAAFAAQHLPEPRPGWALWAGCLVPLVNLAWAPVYVLELAGREGRTARLRKPILTWWVLWSVSTAAAVFAIATSGAQDAQGIANNTEAVVIAYLLGVAAVWAAAGVVRDFEHRSLHRPAHHWVVVADDSPAAAAPTPAAPAAAPAVPAPVAAAGSGSDESATPPSVVLESEGREPAA